MHQRTPSHSYRIPVSAPPPQPSHLHLGGTASTNPPSASATPAPRPRKRHTSDDDPLLGLDALGGGGGARSSSSSHDAASWITSRLGGRPALKRWMLIALGVSASYALLHAATSTSPSASTTTTTTTTSGVASWWSGKTKGGRDPDQDDLDDWLQPPRVDRTALEKLRLLEIHYGADEDDEDGNEAGRGGTGAVSGDEADSARLGPALHRGGGGHEGDGGGMGAQGKGGAVGQVLAAADAPPLVAEIPEFVKPDPLAPPAPERMPADILDRRVCGAVDGDSCRFLVPAWLGASLASIGLLKLGSLGFGLTLFSGYRWQASKRRKLNSICTNSDSSHSR